jgi:hypothetical protein
MICTIGPALQRVIRMSRKNSMILTGERYSWASVRALISRERVLYVTDGCHATQETLERKKTKMHSHRRRQDGADLS